MEKAQNYLFLLPFYLTNYLPIPIKKETYY